MQRNLHYKYNVIGIPTLVFVEATTGKVISEEGRSIIADDPTGENFPWRPKPFTEIIADAKFIDQNKQEITWEQMQGKVTGFFFSAFRVKIHDNNIIYYLSVNAIQLSITLHIISINTLSPNFLQI